MSRVECLNRIWANFDSLDYDLSLWTVNRSDEYNEALDLLKRAVTSLILSSDEYEKHELLK